VRAASLCDAARWCACWRSASLLSREETFFGDAWRGFLAWLFWREQSSDAKAHRENEEMRVIARLDPSLTLQSGAAQTAVTGMLGLIARLPLPYAI
jgi:hypothetical protein